MPRERLSQAKKLISVFVVTICAPGLLLAVFGVRALWQENQTAGRQFQDRLDRGAEVAIRTLADGVARIQSIMDAGLPLEKAFRDFPKDGSWAYVERSDTGLRAYPPNIFPYELATGT